MSYVLQKPLHVESVNVPPPPQEEEKNNDEDLRKKPRHLIKEQFLTFFKATPEKTASSRKKHFEYMTLQLCPDCPCRVQLGKRAYVHFDPCDVCKNNTRRSHKPPPPPVKPRKVIVCCAPQPPPPVKPREVIVRQLCVRCIIGKCVNCGHPVAKATDTKND